MMMIRFTERCCALLATWYERMRDLRTGYIRRAIALRRQRISALEAGEYLSVTKRARLLHEIEQLNIRMTKG